MKRLLCGSMLALIGAMAFAASAAAAEYTTYVGCSLSVEAPPSHSCQLGDTPGAFFESEEEVEYDVCVEFPSGAYFCAEEQEAEEGVLYVNKITSTTPGLHFVDWYVEGSLIATWSFELLAPPPPPPAPVAVSPPPAIAPIPSGPSAACVKAKQQVKKLTAKLQKAEGRKAKAKARAKLKTAKAAAKRLC